MSSFRTRLINWIEAHGVKARAQGAISRHEALIGDNLHLVIEHDPLNPNGDALAWIRLTPLPYDETRRKTALVDMFSLNHKMIGQQPFGLTLSDAGEYISLVCRADAADISQDKFQNIVARFLSWAQHAQQQLAPVKTAAAPSVDLNIRYL